MQIKTKMCVCIWGSWVDILEKCVISYPFAQAAFCYCIGSLLLISENDRCQRAFVMHALEALGQEVTLL